MSARTAFEAGTQFRPFCSKERESINIQFAKECGLLNGCERITGLTRKSCHHKSVIGQN